MTDEQFQLLMEVLIENNRLLKRLIDLQAPQFAPNYQKNLQHFETFDWASISATVEQRDRDGVAVVTWRGSQYLRRSAQNKFRPAIWFSRAIGKDEQGENQYERLITFKDAEVEPLPEKVKVSGLLAITETKR
jgi:hypothetical protein